MYLCIHVGIFQYKMFVSLLTGETLSEDEVQQIQDNVRIDFKGTVIINYSLFQVTSELLGSKICNDYQVFSIETEPIQ